MPSTRTYHSILRSVNNAPVAMPSLATASRIPAPQYASVVRVPIATARSIPRPVNSPSVARKYTPTIVQRARPSTTIASMASSFAAVSISKPVNQAIASPSAPKPTSSLPCSKLASDRIQARRQRVIANLNAAKKRPTAPASISQPSSMPSRAVPPAVVTPASIPQSSSMPPRAVPPPPPAVITPVSILKSPSKPSRVIPPPAAHAPASTLVSSPMPLPPRKRRGTKPYCEGRPCQTDKNGNRPRIDYQGHYYFGVSCKCHTAAGTIPTRYWIRPRLWRTTPAEADVDLARPRVVRFADNLVSSTRTFRRWYNKTWPKAVESEDCTTEAEDDAAIYAIDNPGNEGFPDDDDFF